MSQSLQSLEQAFGSAKNVALIEVVCPSVLVEGSALEHVIADCENRVGDGDDGPLASACGG